MNYFFDLLLVLCIAVTGSSLVSMIGVFIGSDHPALGRLISAQIVATGAATLVFVTALGVFVVAFGFVDALRQVWRRMPHWLIFVFVSINSLVIAGELSYLLIRLLTGQGTAMIDRVPLATGLTGSLAYCAVYALAKWKTPT